MSASLNLMRSSARSRGVDLAGLLGGRMASAEGRAAAENGFWRILKATERSFLYLYDKIWGGGTICISVPRSKFWEDLSFLSPP